MWSPEELAQDEIFLHEIISGPTALSSSMYPPQQHRGTPTFHYGGGIKKRRRLLPEETACLVAAFERGQKPSQETRDELAARLQMSPRAIQIWFQNRRAKVKRDATEAKKATLSFRPAVANKDPVSTEEDPVESAEPAPPTTASQPAHSATGSNVSAGTPLTWEDPDWTTDWISGEVPPASDLFADELGSGSWDFML